jgi:hypothetical protein
VTSVPFDRAIARTQTYVRFRYSRARWFEVNASGDLSYAYFMQGLDGSVGGDFAHSSGRQSFEPDLRELYVGFFTSSVDVRIGQQRLAWGRADAQSPNDVLNARDLRDPFSPEPDITEVPTPLARVDWDFGAGTLELVGSPIFVPDRFDTYGSNWAIIQPDSPAGLRGFFHTMSGLVDTAMFDRFNALIQQTRLPAPGAASLSGGGKLATTVGGFDLDAYYFYGFDRTPVLRIDPAFADAISRIDFSKTSIADFAPFFSAIQAGYPPLTIEYTRRHHVGFDAGGTVGPVGVRFDAAYDTQRVFFRQDLTGVTSPALQGTLSLEYQTGDVRKVFVLEASLLHLLEEQSGLLFVSTNSVSAACVLKFPLFGALDFELRGLATAFPASLAIRPQLAYEATSQLTFDVGAVWLTGEVGGTGHYFERNSNAYLAARYVF